MITCFKHKEYMLDLLLKAKLKDFCKQNRIIMSLFETWYLLLQYNIGF